MTEAEQHLVVQMIGQLSGAFADERKAAHESRTHTHERIDEVVEHLARIDTTMAVRGQIEAQLRDEVSALTKRVARLEPIAAEWRRIQQLGLGLFGLLTIGGGSAIIFCGTWLVNVIRHWLRLS